ncbi:sulfite exporter TauE/SafE family protein [Pseudotenacibaculum sp. MALMAid0570]|uniref:sulfite exporter TauE/SafE family protein n=1 Tax=Pseudotenacibaculum sp. MALMAid0570 TaxID=3143938 RepID=UPI0032DEC2EB
MIYTALLFGLLGSFHCMGMCGPIAFMLPINRVNKTKGILQTSLYHLGRIFSYSLIGMLFGLLGKGFYFFGLQQQLSIAVGLIMIGSIVLPKAFSKLSIARPLIRFTNNIKNQLGSSLKKKESSTFFTIGFLNGLLPCGLVYMAMIASLTSETFVQGMLYMALFGLGTVPLMSAVVLLGNITNAINRQRIQKLIPVFVVVIGAFFVLRGLGLGIPYVSPKPIHDLVDATQTCY